MTVCSIDLRVGGKYHMVFVTGDGTECSFRGTYLEIERPTRIVDTWLFEGWPDAEAVETVDLHETDGVTKVKMNLAFGDQAGRDHMTKTDGQEDSWDKMEDYLRSLVDKWNCLWYLRFGARPHTAGRWACPQHSRLPANFGPWFSSGPCPRSAVPGEMLRSAPNPPRTESPFEAAKAKPAAPRQADRSWRSGRLAGWSPRQCSCWQKVKCGVPEPFGIGLVDGVPGDAGVVGGMSSDGERLVAVLEIAAADLVQERGSGQQYGGGRALLDGLLPLLGGLQAAGVLLQAGGDPGALQGACLDQPGHGHAAVALVSRASIRHRGPRRRTGLRGAQRVSLRSRLRRSSLSDADLQPQMARFRQANSADHPHAQRQQGLVLDPEGQNLLVRVLRRHLHRPGHRELVGRVRGQRHALRLRRLGASRTRQRS